MCIRDSILEEQNDVSRTICVNLDILISKDVSFFCCCPVSYTHLDVYKRQQGKDCKIGLGELGFTITGASDISLWKYGCGRIYYTAQT